MGVAKINDNYLKLPGSYLFSEIARRVSAYSQRGLKRELIRLGIGDVTRPLAPAVTAAMHAAVSHYFFCLVVQHSGTPT